MKGALAFCLLFIACTPLESASIITLNGLNGTTYTYEEISCHPQVVIMVWTSWCYFCRKKMHEIECDLLDSSNTHFFFINAGERESTVNTFIRKQKIANCIIRNILLDKNAALTEKLDIVGVPAFIFLKNGSIVHKGYTFNDSLMERVFDEK